MVSEGGAVLAAPLRIAQVAFLARLAILFVLAGVWALRGDGLAASGVVLAAALSYLAVSSARFRGLLTRHPIVILVDALVVAVVVGVVGAATPFSLALGTSALVVGLWLPFVPGLMVLALLLATHLVLLTGETLDDDGVSAFVLVMPAVLLTLWMLGLAIQRSGRAEARAQASLRDAMAAAATAQERNRIAREMHDTVAKSLQAMALTASSIPRHLERDPGAARARAGELEQDCREVITQVRSLMSELREPAPSVPFSESVAQVVDEWRSTTGRRVTTRLEPVEVTDGLVRYELLMALREALHNVHRHAGRCATKVALTVDEERLVLTVADDGSGADPETVGLAPERGHFGVAGMRERLQQAGGHMELTSSPGRGTTVAFSVHRRGLVEKSQERGET
ncbi:sensor histidine kinase [Phycicoccus flavus]|uniref:Sensor histidine kinase n=1 Tax=Phycicoccus flavus TaxID=2502783 RepID=A0A8T6R4V2_9MICO|nr:histidine kinase [Phycicoccus flavus]NHA69458.1 hypothetical protein [Phycicoccus flavus]